MDYKAAKGQFAHLSEPPHLLDVDFGAFRFADFEFNYAGASCVLEGSETALLFFENVMATRQSKEDVELERELHRAMNRKEQRRAELTAFGPSSFGTFVFNGDGWIAYDPDRELIEHR